MRSAGVAFVLAMVVAAVLTPLVRNLALRFGFVDQGGNSRKIHRKPTPRVGGIAIVAAFYVPLVGIGMVQTGVGQVYFSDLKRALALLLAGVAVAALGLYDDVRGANATKKFGVQIAVSVGLYAAGFRVDQVSLPFDHTLPLGVAALPVTVVWIVGVINALNLIDGLDGLAGGVALFAVGATFIVAFERGDAIMTLFMACLGGGVLGFLFYNFNPASVFMGDTGSMFLGLILAAGSIQTHQKASTTTVALIVPVVILGLPIADTILAMTRRAFTGRPLFSADKEHIHHRLLAQGLTHRKAVLVLYGVCILLEASALAITYANRIEAGIVLTVTTGCFLALLRSIGLLRMRPAPEAAEQRRRNRRLRQAARDASKRLLAAQSANEIWSCLEPVVSELNSAFVKLALTNRGTGQDAATHEFVSARGGQALKSVSCSFSLRPSSAHLAGSLEVTWTDGRTEVDRDEEIVLETLGELVAGCWERIQGAAIGKRARVPSANDGRAAG